MNRRIKKILSGCAAALTLTAAADVRLKNAVIVHPDTMAGWETSAVEDMKTALEMMTGRTYTVQPESKAPAAGVKIYIGNTKAAAKAGIDPEKMESQQFRMKAGNNQVFLIGGSPTGTSYAVSTFLQTRFGVYWLAGDCQVYPKNADPTVKDLDKTQKPDVTDRRIYSLLDRIFVPEVQKKWHTYHRINRMTWPTADRIRPGNVRFSPYLGNCETFFKVVPPQKYFKEHPEYYSMRANGQRDWRGRGNLCLSNREVWDVALKELTDLIKKDRKKDPKTPPTVYTVAPEDNPERYVCHCPECKKRVDEDGSYFVLISEFVNHLARGVRKISPDIWINTSVNGRSDNPDVNFKLEKNVIFFYADRSRHSNFFHPLGDPMNREGYEYVKKWQSKVPVLRLWDYYWLPLNDQPVVAVDAIIGDCRFFREINLFSIFKESEFHFGRLTFLSFHQLQIFLELQLLFDATQDPEKLINDFMDGYYGAAAPEMKEYLAMLRKAQREKPITMEVWRQEEDNRRFPYITQEFLEKARALVKKGLEKVKHDKLLSARVSWELISIAHCSFRFYRNDPVKCKQLQEEYRAAVLLNLETLRLKPALEAKVKQHLAAEQSTVGVKFDDLPPELASLPAEQLIAVPSKYLKGFPPANVALIVDPESSQPKALVKKPLGKVRKKKLLPVNIGVSYSQSKERVSATIKKAPADEKYHWYKIGTATLKYGCWIHVEWAMKLMLRDFYNEPTGNGPDPNKYEVWVSIRMTGPDYVPGSTKETALYVDRGLLVRKP